MRRHLPVVHAHAAALSWRILTLLASFRNRGAGQGLVEYSLLLLMIMVVCVGILTLAGVNLSELWYVQVVSRFP